MTNEPLDTAPADGVEPVGLAAFYRALAEAAERLGCRTLAVAVDEPELGRQLFVTPAEPPAVLDPALVDPQTAWWSDPPPATTPDDIALLRAFGATALRLAAVDSRRDPLDGIEIALRRLPGLHVTGRTGRVVQAVALDPAEAARQVADLDLDAAAVVVVRAAVAGPAGPPTGATAPSGRVELVAVQARPDDGEVEVHLRYAGRRTVGRGALAHTGSGAVDATLAALVELGAISDGVRVAWVRTLDTTPERQFLVGVALIVDGRSARYGLAPGDSPMHAAARATLDACNRMIEHHVSGAAAPR